MTSWVELPSGQDISLVAGYYTVTAAVKDSHTAADIRSLIAGKGLFLVDYQDPVDLSGQTPPSGYRFIATQVWAKGALGSLPWSVPWWLPGDSSHLIRAWYTIGGATPPTAPPPPASSSSWSWIAGFIGVSGLGLYLLRRKGHSRLR